MPSVSDEPGSRPVSALPSVRARGLAFAAILIAGTCGALIGRGVAGVGCTRSCTTPEGIGGVAGAIIAAAGVAVVAVLVLRAMGEWRTIIEERELAEREAEAAEGEGRSAADDRPPVPRDGDLPGPEG